MGLTRAGQAPPLPCYDMMRDSDPPGQGRGCPCPGSSCFLLDGKALAVICHVGFSLIWRHLVQQHIGTLEPYPLEVIQCPHVLVIKEDMWLRYQRLAIRTDKALVLHNINQ